jgi:hypothetical protein
MGTRLAKRFLAYLESLMRGRQEATKHFDDALAAAMGVGASPQR